MSSIFHVDVMTPSCQRMRSHPDLCGCSLRPETSSAGTWRGSRRRWLGGGARAGAVLGDADSIVNHVRAMHGEVGTARAERGGWSQAAEFASLILDAGW